MTLGQIKSEIRRLQRKLARPLAQVAIQRMSQELCDEWSCALIEKEPLPDAQPFIQRVVRAGYRLSTFTSVSRYLNGCRNDGEAPLLKPLLRALLPWAMPHELNLPAPQSPGPQEGGSNGQRELPSPGKAVRELCTPALTRIHRWKACSGVRKRPESAPLHLG